MSSVPQSLEDSPLPSGIGAVSTAVQAALRSAEAATFWTAVVLPFAYLPLLVGGLSGGEALLFAGLVAVNAFAFVVGHDYEPSTQRE